jgi:hypothetical protein
MAAVVGEPGMVLAILNRIVIRHYFQEIFMSSDKRSPSAPASAKPAAAPKGASVSAETAPAETARPEGNFILYPPDSVVDVPNFPHPDPAKDETRVQSQPRANDKPESNWADDDLPTPGAKNARSSLF